ncbi:unnamed protein product [Prunus armeniaca]
MADQRQNPPSDLHNQNPPSTPNPTPTPSKPKAKILDKRSCNMCHKSLKGKERLKKHKKDVHGKVAKFKCGAGPDRAYAQRERTDHSCGRCCRLFHQVGRSRTIDNHYNNKGAELHMENIFCIIDIPHTIITNNGKQFDCNKFGDFCLDLKKMAR